MATSRGRPRKAPSPSTKWAAARVKRVCQRGGSRRVALQANRSARSGSRAAQATRTTPSAAPDESATPVRSIEPPWPISERAEQDPGREDDGVEEPLGEERPGADEHGHAPLPQRLDAKEVAAARGEDVVRPAADRDGREELPRPIR